MSELIIAQKIAKMLKENKKITPEEMNFMFMAMAHHTRKEILGE